MKTPGKYGEVVHVGEYRGANIFRTIKEVPSPGAYQLEDSYRWQTDGPDFKTNGPFGTLEEVIRDIDWQDALSAGRVPPRPSEESPIVVFLPPGVVSPADLEAVNKGLDDLERRIGQLRQDYGSAINRIYALEGAVFELTKRGASDAR